ncbi:MAG: hypothetical protein N2V75_02955 [Methanophagales archaeon]|nr:hypothetical protein [Methanophagales archaeon]
MNDNVSEAVTIIKNDRIAELINKIGIRLLFPISACFSSIMENKIGI